ncbi:hypothetical protein AVEN_119309-1, partial [Araneus ventricosus]
NKQSEESKSYGSLCWATIGDWNNWNNWEFYRTVDPDCISYVENLQKINRVRKANLTEAYAGQQLGIGTIGTTGNLYRTVDPELYIHMLKICRK